MSQHYLVTGCAGFIAARVCEMLLDAGHTVVGIDNLNDAYDPKLKSYRLARLVSNNRFSFQKLDITDRKELFELFQHRMRPMFDGVINLAARAGVRPSVEDPQIYIDTNITGTLNLLDACRTMGVGKFVLASTSSLYGEKNEVPYREDDDTNCPLSPYAATKKGAEALAHTYHHLHGLDVTVLRYFTVYGPAGRPDMSIFRFVRQVAQGEELTVFGDGTQERDFTFVDDIATGTIAALKPLGYEVINLGGDRPVMLKAIISTLEAIFDRKADIAYRPAHPADVQATWADITKAGKLLDWKPTVPIEEGLDRAVCWYKEQSDLASQIDLQI